MSPISIRVRRPTVLGLSDRTIRTLGLSAIMVTHDIRSALAYGDRLIALKDGHVILDVNGEDKSKLTTADIDAVYADSTVACVRPSR